MYKMELSKINAITIVSEDKENPYAVTIIKSGYRDYVNIVYEDPFESVHFEHCSLVAIENTLKVLVGIDIVIPEDLKYSLSNNDIKKPSRVMTEEQQKQVIDAFETLLSRKYKSIQSVKVDDRNVSIIFSDSLQKYIMDSAKLSIIKENLGLPKPIEHPGPTGPTSGE